MKNHVLVVDDDPEFQELISEVLVKNGYQPISALGGIEGIEILAENPDVDVLILDIMMPDMDGYEVCRKIKESDATALPIVFLSAKAQPEDIQRAFDCGGDDYIVKPFELQQLVDVLGRVLNDAET